MKKRQKWINRCILGIVFCLLFSSANLAPVVFNDPVISMSQVEAAGTFTVKNATTSVAKKLDKKLKENKAFTLKVKGSDSKSNKTLSKLNKLIKKVNGQGVVFQTSGKTKSGNYYLYTISTSDAKTYSYGVKYIKKLFSQFQKGKSAGNNKATVTLFGTTYNEMKAYYYFYKKYKASKSQLSFYKYLLSLQTDAMYCDGTTYTDSYLSKKYADKATAASYVIAYKAKNFYSLSDAMKVWVIAKSGYFACNYTRSGYCMTYSGKFYGKTGGDGMETLYNNKATGVCQVYASYEKIVWKALGMIAYVNNSTKINHAWTVVKVKNSKGKTLWIPFDYDLGPSENLVVSDSVKKKYLSSESKRYKLYLSGIKGAPKKKNFKNSDFT
ncbi:MAG: hypothetical protein K5675_00030 [Lachnospiraceae bacterium]|nr:hypothetical protein [Lachnospiraceae bacterium]